MSAWLLWWRRVYPTSIQVRAVCSRSGQAFMAMRSVLMELKRLSWAELSHVSRHSHQGDEREPACSSGEEINAHFSVHCRIHLPC